MIDFEQHKNIVEQFVEQHYPLAHSLMLDRALLNKSDFG